MCKNLTVLNLPNEGDDLVLKVEASNEHYSTVLKIKEGKNSANTAMEVSIRQNAIILR